jgi:hypothetical protein
MKNVTIYVDFRTKKITNRIVSDTEVVVNPKITTIHSCAKAAPDMRAYWCGFCQDGQYDQCFYRGFGDSTL